MVVKLTNILGALSDVSPVFPEDPVPVYPDVHHVTDESYQGREREDSAE